MLSFPSDASFVADSTSIDSQKIVPNTPSPTNAAAINLNQLNELKQAQSPLSSFQFRLSYVGELTPVIRKRADIQSPTLTAPGNWQLGRLLRKGVSGLTTVGPRISGVPEGNPWGA